MNVLVTLNANYIRPLTVMMTSLMRSNPRAQINLFVAHSSLGNDDFSVLRRSLDSRRCALTAIRVSDGMLSKAPIAYRYPREMYYRIFAAQYLPQSVDRILYLDPDLVVINPLDTLYALDFEGCLYAAASHVHKRVRKLNELRLDMPEDGSYINSGVMMMNLELLRREQDVLKVLLYIEKHRGALLLPDQDVLSALYGGRIHALDPLLYNLDERYYRLYNANPKNHEKKIDLEWIRHNTVIVHYCGRNKPWRADYHGKLDVFYRENAAFCQSAGLRAVKAECD